MADLIPKNFPLGSPNAIASYDFFDIAEGTGIRTFYGCAVDGGGDTVTPNIQYILTSQLLFSDEVHTSGSSFGSTVETKAILDLDFDLSPFNAPQVVFGTGNATIPWSHLLTPSGGTSGSIVVRLMKWDGTTETEFASGSTIYYALSGNVSQHYLSTIEIPVTTKQKFKKGDTLRVNVQGIIHQSSGTTQMGMAHDPQNRDGETIYQVGTDVDTTRAIFNIPFQLNL